NKTPDTASLWEIAIRTQHRRDARAEDQPPNRLRTSSTDNPATRSTLLRLPRPAAILIDERDTFKSFAKNSMQASLALPSTGGAVKETLSASPISPVMASLRARG